MMTWGERAKLAISQKSQSGTVKTDKTTGSQLLAVLAVPVVAMSVTSTPHSSVLTVQHLAVLEKCVSFDALDLEPDRWCWPHSSAMNGAEIDLFAVRLRKFGDRGLALTKREALADTLVIRDRESDVRRVCIECHHLVGHGVGSWRCGNCQISGIAVRSRNAQLPADLVVQLQRCDGFGTPHRKLSIPESEVAPTQ
jgi:hypothetical protein